MFVVADLCPYWTCPPTGGGPLRVHNLNRMAADQGLVLQFSVRPTFGHRQGGWSNWIGSRSCSITDRYSEYQYFHPLILGTSYLLYRLGLHSDLFLSSIVRWLSPKRMTQIVDRASIIQVEHPWLFALARRLANGRPIVYVAHNVEAVLWQAPTQTSGKFLSKLTRRPRELERDAIQYASAIVAMSRADVDAMLNEYDADLQRIHVIPNGVDVNVRRPATDREKSEARGRLGLDSRPVLLFIGSDHYPNKEALRYIQSMGAKLTDDLGVQFVIVGDVGRGTNSTDYMQVTGFVEDVADYLAAADIALNPLTSGSGTSLKIVEYLACGLPTITTAMGMRGLDLMPGRDVLSGEVNDFPHLIARLLSNQALRTELSHNGRETVEQNYSWERLGERMLDVYRELSQCDFV